MDEDIAKKIAYGFAAIMVVVALLMVAVLKVLHVKDEVQEYSCLVLGLLSIPFFYFYRYIFLQREEVRSNNLANHNLNVSISDNETVDILKLSYTNDSHSFVKRGSADDPINKVQYVRFIAIIAILESIIIYNIKHYNQTWIAIASLAIIIFFLIGIKLFKSTAKSLFLLFFATAITYAFYYLKMK